MRLLPLALILTVPALGVAQNADDAATRAMHDEMQRTMKELKLQGADGPYFVQYKIVDTDRMEAQASFGSLTSSSDVHNRALSVSVRVGSYELDNSNAPVGTGLAALLGSLSTSNVALPLDDNYEEVRRKIWIATDMAYKKAIEDLSTKKAKLESANRAESVPDFSKAPERHESETLAPVSASMAQLEHLVRAASSAFRTLQGVEFSSAGFEVVNSTEHYLNSEGTTYTRAVPEVYFQASATTRNATGEVFTDSYSAFGRSLSDISAEPVLMHEMQAISDRLTARVKGKVAKRYNGPVLVEEQAAAELFASHFANLLSARSNSSGGNSTMSVLLSGPTASLVNRVGTRVLPDFLTVVDNPKLQQIEGHRLFGDYKFDEEGTPTQETVLVKDGMLKTLLTSRTPARGMLVSTGNERERGVLPGNLIVTATKPVSEDDLKKQLLDLVKTRGLEFGVIVRRLSGNTALEAVRLYPDGHEEAMRDSRVAEVNAASFKDVLAASERHNILTQRAAVTSLASFSPFAADDFISYVVPDMLFEDMSIEHVTNDSPKLPAEASPFVAK